MEGTKLLVVCKLSMSRGQKGKAGTRKEQQNREGCTEGCEGGGKAMPVNGVQRSRLGDGIKRVFNDYSEKQSFRIS